MLNRSDYEPFGKRIAGDVGLFPPRKSFIDRENVSESGYGNFGVRQYDEGIGRFVAIDPLWEDYRAHTPYNYCGNNPVLLSDPNGKAWPLVAALIEIATTAYDVVDAIITFNDPNAPTGEKIASGVDAAGSLVLPLGGYGMGAKAVVKAVSKADDVADGVKAASKSSKVRKAEETVAKAAEGTKNSTGGVIVNSKGESVVVPKGASGPTQPHKGTGMEYQGGRYTNGSRSYRAEFIPLLMPKLRCCNPECNDACLTPISGRVFRRRESGRAGGFRAERGGRCSGRCKHSRDCRQG